MKKTLATFFATSLFFLAAIFAVTISTTIEANAQMRNRSNRIAKAEVDRIIRNVEQRTDTFVRQFDTALDNSRLNGTRREDNLNQRARDLESATDELRREFDRRDRWNENRDEVRKCLNIASDINVAMRNRRLNRATENNWANVRTELNELARVYGLPRIGGSYR
jgi:Skp family chaperone for outer membrane proteins